MAFILCLTLYVMAPAVFFDKVNLGPDNSDFHLPRHFFYHDQYRAGKIPTWNPNIACGAPLESFYEPSNPYYLFSLPAYLWRDNIRSYQISFVILMALIGWNFYIFARFGLKGGELASVAGVAIYMINGFILARMDHRAIVNAYAWAPIIMLGAMNWMSARKPVWIYVMAIGFGLQSFAVYPLFNAISFLLVMLLYLFWNRIKDAADVKRDFKALAGLGAGAFLGLMAGMVALGPFFMMSRDADRFAWHWRTWIYGSFDLRSMIPMFFPNIFGSYYTGDNWTAGASMIEYCGFTGFAIVILIFYYGRKTIGKKGWFFTGAALFGLLLIFGAKNPAGLLFFNLPVFHAWSWPGRYLFLWFFGLGAAAVYVVGAAGRNEFKPGKTALVLAICSTTAGLALVFFGEPLKHLAIAICEKAYHYQPLTSAFFKGKSVHGWDFYAGKFTEEVFPIVSVSLKAAFLTAGAAIFICFVPARHGRLKGCLWLTLICASLSQNAPAMAKYVPARYLRDQPPYSKWVAAHIGDGRFLPQTHWTLNPSWPYNAELDTIYNIPLVQGNLILHPFIKYAKLPQWEYDCRYFGTKYLTNRSIKGADHPSCRKGKLAAEFPQAAAWNKQYGPVRIYEVKDPLPVAYLAPDFIYMPGNDGLRRLIDSPGFDPRRTVVIDNAGEAIAAGVKRGTHPGKEDRAVLKRPGNEKVVVDTFSRGARILVLLDTYFDGWTVTVDGKPGSIMRAFGGFRAVPLREGRHEVVFSYRPVWLRKCLPVSAAAWVIILFGIALQTVNKKSEKTKIKEL